MKRTWTFADADADGIATAQQLLAAGNLDLDGALAVAGAATIIPARHVSLYSAGSLGGVNFAISGLDADGNAISETIAGPSGGTVVTSGNFAVVSRIHASAAVGSNVTAGTADSAETEWMSCYKRSAVARTVHVVKEAGSVTFTLQETLDRSKVYSIDDATFSGKTASFGAFYDGHPVDALRLKLSGMSSSASITLLVMEAGG
jgi:hypothetical protein